MPEYCPDFLISSIWVSVANINKSSCEYSPAALTCRKMFYIGTFIFNSFRNFEKAGSASNSYFLFSAPVRGTALASYSAYTTAAYFLASRNAASGFGGGGGGPFFGTGGPPFPGSFGGAYGTFTAPGGGGTKAFPGADEAAGGGGGGAILGYGALTSGFLTSSYSFSAASFFASYSCRNFGISTFFDSSFLGTACSLGGSTMTYGAFFSSYLGAGSSTFVTSDFFASSAFFASPSIFSFSILSASILVLATLYKSPCPFWFLIWFKNIFPP